eukprot:CAMPEP_0172456044 /NCGR_PEP_ID=MMETSP1065-20121228/13858_1 /TAXON_ID=265537 /ORGANISM="Amphiprora paludosa, Strain CCMP125" /LENGTH=247 /DNA_ID=CAMNT_0013208661 /DNA_START=64 /DNA_END=807 /DNA_ORIENTATION=+
MSTQAYNDGKFLLTWSIASLLTFGLPMIVFGGARLANSEDEYEQAQNAQNQYNNYNAANAQAAYNNRNYNSGCGWWQWGCDEDYQPQNANEEENHAPWWWMWSEDERREDGAVSPTVIVIYVWHLIMLWAITLYGRRSVVGGGSLYGVSATCLMFANYSFISMLFLGGLEGAIFDDARILDENGWYGQFGVLLYMTMFTSVIFGICYFFAFRRLASEKEITKVDVAPSDYMSYDEPKKVEEGAAETA